MRSKVKLAAILIGMVFMVLMVRRIVNKTVAVAYINDGTVRWDNIEYVEIYAEGCAVPPTFIIDDSRTIKSLVTSITDIWGYRRIPKERYLEGLCDIWIKFSNGVCVGTYKDINQGYVDLELRATGGPFYKLPKKFRENVLELLEQHQEILQYQEKLKEKAMDFQDYSDDEKQAMCVAIDYVDSITILKDYPEIVIERLSRLPERYPEEVDESKIDSMDWLVTVGDPYSGRCRW